MSSADVFPIHLVFPLARDKSANILKCNVWQAFPSPTMECTQGEHYRPTGLRAFSTIGQREAESWPDQT